jgi:lipid-binding SYLF domain-containing protein
MKAILFGLTLLLSGLPAALAVERADLDERIVQLTEKFEALQQKPDRAVPAEALSRANGIVLLDRTKAGFGFAYQGGKGLVMVKDNLGHWSAPAFLTANEASFGFQIGGEQNFCVMLFSDTNSIHELTGPVGKIGGEARGTAGNDAAGVGGQVTEPKQYGVQVYTDRSGLYGGAFVKNGAIAPDDKANLVYYGEALTMQNILFDAKVGATPAAASLREKIKAFSKQ